MPTLTAKPQLTAIEAAVAVGIAKARTYSEISGDLELCFETVRSIVGRLRDKTGCRRKPELAVWASQNLAWLSGVAAKLKKAK